MIFVDGVQECARHCLDLSQYNVTEHSYQQDGSVSGSPKGDGEQQQVASLRNVCHVFEYVDMKELETTIRQADMLDFCKLLNLKNVNPNGGVCLVSKKLTEETSSKKSGEGRTKEEFDKVYQGRVKLYEINHEMLFERQAGIGMVASPESEAPESSSMKLRNSQKLIFASSVKECAKLAPCNSAG